jgi:SNF2 family DNA or RNA helicase
MIKYSEIKGNTGAMMNILKDFNNGDLQVILLNTSHAGSGIDISTATDVIIFNSMPKEKAQAIGRAQRVGRTEKLTIHNLYYSNEIENNFELEQEPSN